MDRSVVAAAAVIMQAGLGSFYAWSVFREPLSDVYGASVTGVNGAFFLANLTFSLAAFGAGFLLRRADPRAVGVASGLLYGAGLLGVGAFGESLPVLYLAYGVVAGTGLGVIVPVTVLPRWFPDRPGLAYGLAVCGFGAGPIVGAPAAAALIQATGGPLPALAVLGPAYALLVGGAALCLKNPSGHRAGQNVPPSGGGWTLGEALRTWQWYAIFAMFLLNATAGLAIISDARTLAAAVGGAPATLAAGFVVVMAVADTSGRLFWPLLSDKVGRTNVFLAMFLLQAVAFLLLPLLGTGSFVFFAVFSAVVPTCYGGGFGTIGALAETYYGKKDTAAIYASIVLASGLAGFGAPVLLSFSVDVTGSYAPALYATAALTLAAAAIPILLRTPRARSGERERNGPP